MEQKHRRRLEKLLGHETGLACPFYLTKSYFPANYWTIVPATNNETKIIAEAVVRLFLAKKLANICSKNKISISNAQEKTGMDLTLEIEGLDQLHMEVKGARSLKPTANLVFSSKNCTDSLKSGYPLFRVVGLEYEAPMLYILWYGSDFDLTEQYRCVYKAL